MSIQVFLDGKLIGTAMRSGTAIYVRSAEGAPIGSVADFDAAAALLMRRAAA